MNSEHLAPVEPYGLTGVRVAHRAILADGERLAGLLAALAGAAEPPAPARARAIAGYVHRYNDAVRGHHREDEILWPLVLDAVPDAAAAVAGIVRFVDDLAALDALQADCDAAAARFAAEPGRHARRLAGLLTRRRDLLAAHIEAEEEHVLPVIAGRVPGAAHAAARARMHGADRPADPAWALAWMLSHATEAEARCLLPSAVADRAALEPQLRAYAAEASAVFTD
ncbi:Hemerythrin HHE cation binding domain protein [Actinobacteria bacterium OV450]|nr:Hemerythrin HHE cation binding domain protein [Actinobacteria bacterium OV450]